MKKGDVVGFYWLDADNESGWLPHDEESDNSLQTMYASGRFVSKGPKFITLSFCHNQDADEWMSKARFPVDWIVGQIEVLKEFNEDG